MIYFFKVNNKTNAYEVYNYSYMKKETQDTLNKRFEKKKMDSFAGKKKMDAGIYKCIINVLFRIVKYELRA